MADIKISELGAASAVNATDLFPMTSSGVTVKATAQQIKNYMGVGNLADLTTDVKTSAVASINEVDTHADTAQTSATNAQQMIAPILSSLVAPSGGLASGDQFIYQGLLYKATAAIAQGGAITIDGNCELADSVTEQIVRISDSITVLSYSNVLGKNTQAVSELYSNAIVINNLVFLNGYYRSSSLSSDNYPIAITALYANLRPKTQKTVIGMVRNTNDAWGPYPFAIDTNGNIYQIGTGQNTHDGYFSISYTLD